MEDLGVIDRFLNVFTAYIDSGFGLLGGEVAFLTAALVVIDITLAGLLWAMSGGGDDVLAKFLKKVLYVGAFAFILGNFNDLSSIVFRSFAGLGLTASGSTMTEGELLRPGRLASVGVDAARPILEEVGDLAGFPEVFANLDLIAVLLLAWLIVIVSFFILAVQLFVTLIEFKLTTLAGFVLVPFALWNKTAFLAEKVLGNVVSSGIKVLVLAVIVGIGSSIFGEFIPPADTELTIDHALATMLGSLALFALGLFGPGIATGLVSGAPQLGAGAAAGAGLAVGGMAAAGGAAVGGAARLAGAAGGSSVRAAAGGYQAFKEGVVASGTAGGAAIAPGLANVARTSGAAIADRARQAVGLNGNKTQASNSAAPAWAQRHRQQFSHGAMVAAHAVRSGDRGGGGANPSLYQDT